MLEDYKQYRKGHDYYMTRASLDYQKTKSLTNRIVSEEEAEIALEGYMPFYNRALGLRRRFFERKYGGEPEP